MMTNHIHGIDDEHVYWTLNDLSQFRKDQFSRRIALTVNPEDIQKDWDYGSVISSKRDGQSALKEGIYVVSIEGKGQNAAVG